VIDETVGWKALGPRVFPRFELGPELCGALAPVRTRKGEKLPGPEVTGMGRDEVQKVCFLLGVTEGLKGLQMRGGQAHRARILAVRCCWSRMRRRRAASSRGLYRAKPALAFSATPRGR